MAEPRDFRVTALDATKLALLLYISGLLISSLYYLKFSILSLDLLRTHSILIGSYFFVTYAAIPALALLALESVKSQAIVTAIFVVLLLAKDIALAVVLSVGMMTNVVLLALQLAAFATLKGGLRTQSLVVEYRPLTFGGPQLAAFIAMMVVFAIGVFGQIPGYLGGGRPIPVTVFADPQDLPSNRFIRTSGAQVNPKLLSHRLSLLYEGNDQIYFVTESTGSMKGYSIMRLRRDKVLRIDYVTPVRFQIEGGRR